MTHQEVLDKTGKLVTTFTKGSFKLSDFSYKFRYYQFLHIAYLYLHGVDNKNPDLLSPKGKNTFIPTFFSDLIKINEQTRIDLKEIGFSVDNTSPLAEFIVKAANRKVMSEDNDWTDVQEQVTDDANWYGSGYKKVYEVKGVQKHVHVDPWNIMWDLRDFKKSAKVERITRSVVAVLNDEKYSKSAKESLRMKYNDKDISDAVVTLYQYIDDENMFVVDIVNDIVFFESKRPQKLWYVKYDHEKRRGAPDAPGVGVCEKTFNIIVQEKVARERLDLVQEITSKLIFTKMKDGKNDKLVNKQFQNIKTGLVVPTTSPDQVITPVQLGGQQQIVELTNHINTMQQERSTLLKTPEVLSGDAKTLGANSSGVAIQSLAEYASSVHKDVKKRFARVATREYKDYIQPYVLRALDSNEDIKKYLTPTEFNVVKRNVKGFMLSKAELEALLNNTAFDKAEEEKKIESKLKQSGFIPGTLLEQLRDDVKGITPIISGEKASKTVIADFNRELKNDYRQNPQVFQDPVYIELIKRDAKVFGIDELEIDEFIKTVSNIKI